MRYVTISLLIAFDEVDAVFDFSVDVVVVGCIEVSPEYIFFVEHEFEELDEELVFGCSDLIDGAIDLFCSF